MEHRKLKVEVESISEYLISSIQGDIKLYKAGENSNIKN
jgi:hypothetical protein